MVHGGGTKYLWCTHTPIRGSPQADRQLEHYRSGNEGAEILSGSTGTRQCSTHQFELISNGTIVTDECDNKCHTSAAQYFVIDANEPNKDQETVLILDLQENFYS